MNASDYEITSGYVGSLGKTYKTATDQTLSDAISAAIMYNSGKGFTTESIVKALDNGWSVAWRQSPNYYYDHSEGMIRRKRSAKPTEMVECDCGHSVPRGQRMSASLGSSCPACYDRMSDGE